MSSTLAATVSKIKVPRNHLLLGVHPILAMFFKTDDTKTILDYLLHLTDKQAESLIQEVSSSLQSSIYPHKHSVWMFNDPNVEIEMLTQALINKEQNAQSELEGILELHGDTYPFIEVMSEPLLDIEDIIQESSYENPIDLEQDDPIAIPKDKGVNPLGAIFIPTATLGSLYILSKIAKEY